MATPSHEQRKILELNAACSYFMVDFFGNFRFHLTCSSPTAVTPCLKTFVHEGQLAIWLSCVCIDKLMCEPCKKFVLFLSASN